MSTEVKSRRIRPSSPSVEHRMPRRQTVPYRTGCGLTVTVVKAPPPSTFVERARYWYQSAVGSFAEPELEPTQVTSTWPALPATTQGRSADPPVGETTRGVDQV